MLKTYLTRLHDIAIRGDAREESFYAPLSELLGAYAQRAGLSKIHITTLPKQTEAGNPDFRVWDGKQFLRLPPLSQRCSDRQGFSRQAVLVD